MSFAAKFPGHCDNCVHAIIVGQEVEFTLDNRLVHVVCPPDPKPGKVCPSCFLELPCTGVCDDCS